jgi:hypothetical protein
MKENVRLPRLVCREEDLRRDGCKVLRMRMERRVCGGRSGSGGKGRV